MRAWQIAPLLGLTASCAHVFHARPHSFACAALDRYATVYPDDPLTAAIRRDAGFDDDIPQSVIEAGSASAPRSLVSSGLAAALSQDEDTAARHVLVLSGGGQWGAFGAGFLAALAQPRGGYDAVTGISTGAIQGLFVAADRLDQLKAEYAIGQQSDIAHDKGDLALLTMGARYDTAPLRRKLLDFLCPAGSDACGGLAAIAAAGHPSLLVGTVRSADGSLQVVDVSKMVRDAYPAGTAPPLAEARALGDCVTGVVMASAAVPAQLRPVRIDGVTYVDGGVRSSVFAAVVGATAASLQGERGAPEIAVDVVRNGPTVVFRNRDPEEPEGTPPVDRRPDVKAIAGQSYATIVNQVEVSSIAALRLNYPTGPIRVITADGYNSPRNPGTKCQRPRRERVFDPDFMRCLIAWGAWRATEAGGRPRWIVLAPAAPGAGRVSASESPLRDAP